MTTDTPDDSAQKMLGMASFGVMAYVFLRDCADTGIPIDARMVTRIIALARRDMPTLDRLADRAELEVELGRIIEHG